MRKDQYLVGFEREGNPVYGQPKTTPIHGEFVLRDGISPMTRAQAEECIDKFPGRTPTLYKLVEVK